MAHTASRAPFSLWPWYRNSTPWYRAAGLVRSFNLPVVITRGNNVYGPHQYPEKLIPKFINQLMRGRKLTIHGTGEALRGMLWCSI